MSFFDKLKNSMNSAAAAATAATETAVEKTKTLAAMGRVKVAIVAEEDKLKKAYIELGKLFFQDYKEETEQNMDAYLPFCVKAEDALAQIQRLNEELEKLKAEDQSDPEPKEEPVIYADFTEVEDDDDIEVEVIVVDPAPEAETEAPVEEPMTEEGTVGTLYVDITGQE